VTFAGEAREWARVFNDAALEIEVESHARLLRRAFAGDDVAREALARAEAKRVAEALARLAPDEREAFASAMAAFVFA
jgi:DNA-directed RNA polymerase specialized sigma24 family protein